MIREVLGNLWVILKLIKIAESIKNYFSMVNFVPTFTVLIILGVDFLQEFMKPYAF